MEETENTFNKNLSIFYKKSANSIAIDSTGKFAALGGRKGLYIIDLDSPYELKQSLTHQNTWEFSLVEWNPHSQKKNFIASTANQQILIWNLNDSGSELQTTLPTHQRAVSDISWSLFDMNLLATCSADTYINLWDIRDPKKTIKKESFCGWTAGAVQVKWNRHDPMILASAHNGEVRIWDVRKVSSPITFITAHMAKIFGIDWSFVEKNELVTCSEDKFVKFWDINQTRLCKSSFQPGISQIIRAKYTPFGHSIITMGHSNLNVDYSLKMWNLFDFTNPVHSFIGHTDSIISFDWRIRKNEFQLVTWAKNQELRLWYINNSIKELSSSIKSKENSLNKSSEIKRTSSLEIPIPLSPSSSPQSSHSSPDTYFPTVIQNLSQEFAILEKKKPRNIIIEETNLQNRTCVVSVSGIPSLKMKIIFPSLYPNGAVPSFQFITEENSIPLLNIQTQAKIIEKLTDNALSFVENNRPCLYNCLCQLVICMKDFIEETSKTEISLVSSNSQITNLTNQTWENKRKDENIPSPRICGGIFGGNGFIAYFFNKNIMYNSSEIGIRSYKDFKSQSDLILNSSSPLISRGFSEDPTLSSYENYFNPLNSRTPPPKRNNIGFENFSFPFDITDTFIDYPSGNNFSNSITTVYIKDISFFLPLEFELARLYKLSGNITEICETNKKIAIQVGRQDLVQLWDILQVILDEKLKESTIYTDVIDSLFLSIDWPYHPFGRNLLKNIFQHYEKIGDIQTLAVVSCILEIPSISKSKNSLLNFNFQLNINQTKSPNKKGFHFRNSQTDIIINNELKKEQNSLLDPNFQFKYDYYKIYYADILYRWNLLEKKNSILKYINKPLKPIIGVVFSIYCRICDKQLQESNFCPNCKIYGISCSICHIAVRGTSTFCFHCGHGGHFKHMIEWFKEEEYCPAGCGCKCLEYFYNE